MPNKTGVTTQTISSTKMAIATAFMGVAAVAAAAAGLLTTGPDLVVQNLSATGGNNLSPGEFTFEVKNVGTRPARGPFYLSFSLVEKQDSGVTPVNLAKEDLTLQNFFIAKYPNINANGLLIQIPNKYLKAGQSVLLAGTFNTEATYNKLYINLDILNRVKELDESNNLHSVFVTAPPVQITCTETDSGNDIFTKGIVSTSTPEFAIPDYCMSTSTLNEFFCTGEDAPYISSQETACEFGCLDGACLTGATTTPVTSTPIMDKPQIDESILESLPEVSRINTVPATDEKFFGGHLMSVWDQGEVRCPSTCEQEIFSFVDASDLFQNPVIVYQRHASVQVAEAYYDSYDVDPVTTWTKGFLAGATYFTFTEKMAMENGKGKTCYYAEKNKQRYYYCAALDQNLVLFIGGKMKAPYLVPGSTKDVMPVKNKVSEWITKVQDMI